MLIGSQAGQKGLLWIVDCPTCYLLRHPSSYGNHFATELALTQSKPSTLPAVSAKAQSSEALVTVARTDSGTRAATEDWPMASSSAGKAQRDIDMPWRSMLSSHSTIISIGANTLPADLDYFSFCFFIQLQHELCLVSLPSWSHRSQDPPL